MPTVGPELVVMSSPAFADHLGFRQRVEKLSIQYFPPVCGNQAFRSTVLPGFARINVGHLDAVLSRPLLNGIRDELTAIVATDERRLTIPLNEFAEYRPYIKSLEGTADARGQAIGRRFVLD